jgi:DNA-directed RNA polymerase subunit M/transcription elongation factor TFIIS
VNYKGSFDARALAKKKRQCFSAGASKKLQKNENPNTKNFSPRTPTEAQGAAPPAMLTFCPTCANMLLVDHSRYGGGLKLYCMTCPYVYDITTNIRSEVKIQKKEVDDVLGGEDAWKNVDKAGFGHFHYMLQSRHQLMTASMVRVTNLTPPGVSQP